MGSSRGWKARTESRRGRGLLQPRDALGDPGQADHDLPARAARLARVPRVLRPPFVIPLDLDRGEKRSSKGTAAIYPQGMERPDVVTQTYDWTVEAWDIPHPVSLDTKLG